MIDLQDSTLLGFELMSLYFNQRVPKIPLWKE
jgi:hypothetical protein